MPKVPIHGSLYYYIQSYEFKILPQQIRIKLVKILDRSKVKVKAPSPLPSPASSLFVCLDHNFENKRFIDMLVLSVGCLKTLKQGKQPTKRITNGNPVKVFLSAAKNPTSLCTQNYHLSNNNNKKPEEKKLQPFRSRSVPCTSHNRLK